MKSEYPCCQLATEGAGEGTMAHLAPDAARRFGWRTETKMATAMDPETEGWARSPDDPAVQRRLAELRRHAGIPAMEVIDGRKVRAGDEGEVARAVELFERDGAPTPPPSAHHPRHPRS